MTGTLLAILGLSGLLFVGVGAALYYTSRHPTYDLTQSQRRAIGAVLTTFGFCLLLIVIVASG